MDHLGKGERMMQHVVVTPYSSDWPTLYETASEELVHALAGELVAIYHIGSTAVPGLAAKPVIDIMPVVRHIAAVDNKRQTLVMLGYEYMGEFGIPGRRYLRRGGAERTHQVHIFGVENEQDIRRHLAVRDYLRTHTEEAYAYGELKKELARRYPYDIEGYCDGKDSFVKALERRALAWYRGKIFPEK